MSHLDTMAPPDEESGQPVIVSRDDSGLTTITLNRPGQYNVLSEDMLAALTHALDEVAADELTRVVILAARGKAFCAGHDLKQMRQHGEREYHVQLFESCSAMMLRLVSLPQPVIARVQGLSTAAGCQLVATADLAIAARSARFAVSGINLGLFCSTPSVAVSRNLSRKKAMKMLLTGEFISAEDAVDAGLINECVADDALDEAVRSLALTIAAKPPEAIRLGKRLFYRQLEMSLEQAYREAGCEMASNMMFGATIEGIDAFIQKRPPNWSGPD